MTMTTLTCDIMHAVKMHALRCDLAYRGRAWKAQATPDVQMELSIVCPHVFVLLHIRNRKALHDSSAL
jgi:hypothetical protein